MIDSKQVEWCRYAVVGRVSPQARTSVPPSLAGRDLLLAIAEHQLHIFVRQADRLVSSCACHGSGEDGTGLLSKHGFVCPHVTAYDDASHVLTIPIHSIVQVCMTYRTATSASTSGVATRTKDLIVKASSTLVLWLEFEHNLARGWFLEALTAAVLRGDTAFDIDYLDLGDPTAIACLGTHANTNNEFQPQPLSSPLGVLRDAWRHATYEKIKLALQVAHDTPMADDPTVSCLLTTAMELSTRLDEPDLNAFTWLTSGFLNRQQGFKSVQQDLALVQVVHSLDLARENSLEYLTCLALHCAASMYLQRPETVSIAREMLMEATKLLTLSPRCAAMEPSLKMQLHATLRDLNSSDSRSKPVLQRAQSVMTGRWKPTNNVLRSDSSSRLMEPKDPQRFNLWAHIFGSGLGSSTRPTAEVDGIKLLLLDRVLKPSRSFYVDVLGAHGVIKAHLRVFYDTKSTIAWLQEHIMIRYQASGKNDDLDHKDAAIELWYDPERKELVPLDTVLSHWIPASKLDYTLHAKLTLRIVSSHRSSVVISPTKLTKPQEIEGPSVLCALCGKRIPLDKVEDHSETCY